MSDANQKLRALYLEARAWDHGRLPEGNEELACAGASGPDS
jgi:hypothetical protein